MKRTYVAPVAEVINFTAEIILAGGDSETGSNIFDTPQPFAEL